MTAYAFVYASDVKAATRLIDDLETALSNHGVAAGLVRRATLAVSEAFTNALIHGNRQNVCKNIKVVLTVDESLISADIIDEGTGGLRRIKARTPVKPLDEGGRGIDLILHYASSAQFVESDAGGLQVSLTFRRDKDKERV